MHQTAQRDQLASTTPSRVEHRRGTFKSEANNRGAIAAVRAEAVPSEQVSGDPAKPSQAREVSVKPYPYQPGHQVELLHLQAEADALILQLQTAGQKQTAHA